MKTNVLLMVLVLGGVVEAAQTPPPPLVVVSFPGSAKKDAESELLAAKSTTYQVPVDGHVISMTETQIKPPDGETLTIVKIADPNGATIEGRLLNDDLKVIVVRDQAGQVTDLVKVGAKVAGLDQQIQRATLELSVLQALKQARAEAAKVNPPVPPAPPATTP